MKAGCASRLPELETSKLNYGAGSASRIEKLLASMRDVQFHSAETLIRFHDALLFLRAFPQSRKVAQLADDLLTGIVLQVERLRAPGADLNLRCRECFMLNTSPNA